MRSIEQREPCTFDLLLIDSSLSSPLSSKTSSFGFCFHHLLVFVYER